MPLPQPVCTPKSQDEGELFVALENNFRHLKAKELKAKIAKSSAQIMQKIAQLQRNLESLEDKNILEKNAQKEAKLGQLILQNLYLYPNFKGKRLC